MQLVFFILALLAYISPTTAFPASSSPDASALAAASSAVLGLLGAIPASIVPTGPPTIDDAHFATTQYAKNAMKCVNWWPPQRDRSIQDCNSVCGEAFTKATGEQKVASIACIGNSKTWDRYDGMLLVP